MRKLAMQLAALRRERGAAVVARMPAILRKLRGAALGPAEAVRAVHDELLYLCAYPATKAIHRAACAALDHLALRIGAANRRAAAVRRELDDSGISATELRHEFSIDFLRWLASVADRRTWLAWRDGSLGDAFDDFLQWLFPTIEADGLLTHAIRSQEWLEAARGSAKCDEIGWLLREIDARGGEPNLLDRVFDACAVGVRWTPAEEHSRTFNRFPDRPIFAHDSGMLRQVDLCEQLARSLPSPVRLSVRRRAALIGVARAALAVRHRETDPVTYASADDVTLLRLERGIDVLLLGLSPTRRLPVESFVGFVAARNRVPIAYGGGWVFGRRCEIGVNLFAEFRGGESAVLFSQVMRVYRHRFAVKQFLVDPYQFGADNDEAIRSGAFWFYYRLGFRPIDAGLHALADREAEKIAASADYRTPAARLRRLASSKLYFDVVPGVGTSSTKPFQPIAPDLIELGLAVTRWIGGAFAGDRAKAQTWAMRRVVSRCKIDAAKLASTEVRTHVERLALLVAASCDLRRYSAADRDAVGGWLLAKGAASERAYVHASQTHPRLLHDFARLADRSRAGCTKRKPELGQAGVEPALKGF